MLVNERDEGKFQKKRCKASEIASALRKPAVPPRVTPAPRSRNNFRLSIKVVAAHTKKGKRKRKKDKVLHHNNKNHNGNYWRNVRRGMPKRRISLVQLFMMVIHSIAVARRWPPPVMEGPPLTMGGLWLLLLLFVFRHHSSSDHHRTNRTINVNR
eukprot:gene11069-7700_t